MRRLVLLAAAALLAADVLPAFAQSPVLPPCTCRLFGESMPLGAHACLKTANGPRDAVCSLEQNVTTWRTGPNICPEASTVPQMSPRLRG